MDTYSAPESGDTRPLGLFDSGLGGLSVLREIRRLLPAENLLYFADSAHCPYGPRGADFIRGRSAAIADFLLSQGAKALVVACNTASVAALGYLRVRYSVPVVGIVPAVKPAAHATKSGRIGVLATQTTVRGDAFAELVRNYASDLRVNTVVGAGLVELVERGDIQSPQAAELVRAYVDPLVEDGADVVVLGCTHYPFLAPLIREVVGPSVVLLDPAEAVARQTVRVLEARGLRNAERGPGWQRLYTSGDPEAVRAVTTRLLGLDPGAVLATNV